MKKFIKSVLKAIYKVISFLNLQPLLLVALVGAVLYFTGVYDGNQVVRICVQVTFILSALYAIGATVKRLLGFDKKVKRSKGAQIIKKEPSVDGEEDVQTVPQPVKVEVVEKPRYFRVKQNPDYVMAEYADRYELFLITDGGLKKVRTDYKR